MAIAWITAEDLDDPSNADASEAARAASMLLYQLSGRRYPGIRQVTEVYERPGGCVGYRPSRPYSFVDCGCYDHRRARVRLRYTPVRSVAEVVVNWESDPRVIDPGEYQVVDRVYLRAGLNATWSPCANLQVTYTAGANVPEAGLRAARVLGNELLKARTDPNECALPDRVTAISRQGVSYTVLDPQDFLKDGRTGLYEVDLFLKAVNPDNARKRARVFSPDVTRGGRLT